MSASEPPPALIWPSERNTSPSCADPSLLAAAIVFELVPAAVCAVKLEEEFKSSCKEDPCITCTKEAVNPHVLEMTPRQKLCRQRHPGHISKGQLKGSVHAKVIRTTRFAKQSVAQQQVGQGSQVEVRAANEQGVQASYGAKSQARESREGRKADIGCNAVKVEQRKQERIAGYHRI